MVFGERTWWWWGVWKRVVRDRTSLRTVVIFELHFFMIFFLSLFENNILEYMNHRALQAHTNVRGTSPR